MAQHDYDIANADGATVRADLNSLFEAIATRNSGATAPSTTFAFMAWFDTANNLLKMRNAANNAWVTVASLVGTTWTPYLAGSAIALGTAAPEDVGTAVGDVVQLVGVGSPAVAGLPAVDGSQLTGVPVPDVLIYTHETSSGSVGSSYTAGAWRTVTLNTEVVDSGGHGSLSSNQVTLAAGTYEFVAVAALRGTGDGNARLRLYNATDAAIIQQGPQTRHLSTGEMVPYTVQGYFTIGASKAVELQVYPGATNLDNDSSAVMTTGENEVWTEIKLRKVA